VSDDPVTWLRAQLDDDERVARAAADYGAEWTYSSGSIFPGDDSRHPGAIATGTYGELEEQYGEHIARHDPARVLRQVERDRRILDDIVDRIDGLEDAADHEYRVQPRTESEVYVSDALVRLLALPYADRPGYRDEWRPA
jgi:hypothetical protein